MLGRPPSRFPFRKMEVGDILVFPAKDKPLRSLQQEVGSAIGQLRRLYGCPNKYQTKQIKEPGFESVAVRRVA